MVPIYRKFWATYPYMYSPCNLLAALAVDFSTIPVGLWGIFTLDTDTWVHGDGKTAKKQPGIIMKTTQDLGTSIQAADVAADDLIFLRSQIPSATEANDATQDQDEVQYSNLCQSTSNCTKSGHGAEQSEGGLVALSEAAELLDEAEPKKEK